MEVIFGLVFIVLVIIGSGMYLSDRPGWHATFKRVSRGVRANLESGKEAKMLEKLPDTDAKEAWMATFEGKPLAVEQNKTTLKHEIVRHSYEKSLGDLWPKWHCKCGHSYAEPVIYTGLADAEKRARQGGQNHVRTQNALEEKLEKSKGQWAF